MEPQDTKLKTFDEALTLVIRAAEKQRLPHEGIGFSSALGRILAQELQSSDDYPSCDNSAMDGYCVRHQDIRETSSTNPVRLKIAGNSMAGHPLEVLPEGQTAYIATGGMLPRNADTIVKIEDVTVNPEETEVTFPSAPPPGTYIRRRGKDMKAGSLVLGPGELITPSVIGIMATLGQMAIQVVKKPGVAIMTSGDEVLMPFENPKPWQLRNSNTFTLMAQAVEAGAAPMDFGIVRDSTDQAMSAVERAAQVADVIVTCGGISLGKKDPFIAAYRKMGIDPLVHGVSLKPGKPFFFGFFKGKPLFGLPGNQASSSVTFELFVRPFLTRMMGQINPDRPVLWLPLDRKVKNTSGRDHFLRARIINRDGRTYAQTLEAQDSHLQMSLLRAQLLVRHPAQALELEENSLVECRLMGA